MRPYAPLLAAAALALGLLAATTNAAGAVPAASTSSRAPGTSAAMTTTTWKFYSTSTMSNLYTSNGQPVTNPSAAPTVGGYLVSTDNDYMGTQADHASDVFATDHVFCLVTKAPATAVCSAQIATAQGMLVADNSVQNFATQSPTVTFKITGGTGAYQGATGTVVVTAIGSTNNSEAVVTWST